MKKYNITITSVTVEARVGSAFEDHFTECLQLAADFGCVVNTEFNGSNFVVRNGDTIDEMHAWYVMPRNTWDSKNVRSGE